MDDIRCLAVQQPWAWAQVVGEKDIETRTWSTGYRGPLFIAASASKTNVNAMVKERGLDARCMTFGAVVGVVDVIDVVPLNKKLESNLWAWGPVCWRVSVPAADVDARRRGSLEAAHLPGLRSAAPLVLLPRPTPAGFVPTRLREGADGRTLRATASVDGLPVHRVVPEDALDVGVAPENHLDLREERRCVLRLRSHRHELRPL